MDQDGTDPSGSDSLDRPDAADVVAAAAGDIAAFERLVVAVQGPVWRYLVHLVGDRGLAEDLAQEVLIRVYRKLGTLRNPDGFKSWVLVVARNAAYDAGRAKKRRPLELVPDPDADLVRTQGDPHVGAEVRDALDRLEPDLREALVLVSMIGLTYREAGETIGVPEGTVKSRVFRARQTLLVMLGDDDGR